MNIINKNKLFRFLSFALIFAMVIPSSNIVLGVEENEVYLESESEIQDKLQTELQPEENVVQEERSESTEALNSLETMITLERPFDNTSTTGDLYLKGWALSGNGIDRIEVYSNGILLGQATYGIKRQDISNKYPEYGNEKSGFDFNIRGLSSGINNIEVVVYEKRGETHTRKVSINVNTQQKTPIIGQATLDRDKMITFLRTHNPNKDLNYVIRFVDYVIEEANYENVRYDVMFAQIMNETNFLKFTGDVKEEQNNFAGIGATGGGNPGESFKDIQTGIRAVVQHLKAYASTEPLKNECVDPRFKYVERGSAIYLEHLGINENPTGKGWAAFKGYGYNIYDIMTRVNDTVVENKATFKSYGHTGELIAGNEIVLQADSDSEATFKYLVQDLSTGQWSVIRDYTTEKNISWKPTNPGKYRIGIWVKHKNSVNESDEVIGFILDIKDSKSYISLTKYSGNLMVGNEIVLQATSDGLAQYKFLVEDLETNQWTVLKDYNSSSIATWTPQKTGKYRVAIWVKNKYSNNENDDIAGFYLDIKEAKSKILSYGYSGDLFADTSIVLKATSDSSAEYKFLVQDYSNNQWTVIRDYNSNPEVVWTPNKQGHYRISIWVKSKYSNNESDEIVGFNLNIQDRPFFKTYGYDGALKVGNKINLKAETYDEAQYKFLVEDLQTNQWTILSNYSNSSQVEWIAEKAGFYKVVIWGRDNTTCKEECAILILEIQNEKSYIYQYSYDGELEVNKKIILKAVSDSQAEYKFLIQDYATNQWTVIRDYSFNPEAVWIPNKQGKYRVAIWVKNKYSENESDDVIGFNLEITRNKVIVVDPGHGGSDPGAVATHEGIKYEEAKLNMEISLKLKSKLEQHGYKVAMTVDPIKYLVKKTSTVTLKERSDFANALGADAFVSIHHDSSSDKKATGVTTFYSSWKPELDNTDIVQGKDPNGFEWYDLTVDLTPTQEAIKGKELAKTIVDTISNKANYNNKKEHDRNLAVTKNTNMPSVLVECGFITNPDEAKKVSDNENQDIVAESIANSIIVTIQ